MSRASQDDVDSLAHSHSFSFSSLALSTMTSVTDLTWPRMESTYVDGPVKLFLLYWIVLRRVNNASQPSSFAREDAMKGKWLVTLCQQEVTPWAGR